MKKRLIDSFPSVLFSCLLFVSVFFFSRGIIIPKLGIVYAFIWPAYIAVLGFFIVYTQKVSLFRRIFFITLAAGFIIHFKFILISDFFKTSCFEKTPYCHIAIASSFFNYLYQQYLGFMSGNWQIWGVLSLAFLWLFITIIIGRAWCSWTCFYGGIDELFSICSPKKVLSINKTALKFRNFPMLLLVIFLIVSFSAMLPVFCLWLCPFKASFSFMDTNPFIRNIQISLMLIALVFLIILPILTRKRTFCSFLCPFGAWQAFFGRFNPFRISISEDKCSDCGLCAEKCPVFAISKENLNKKPEILDYCNLCGLCVDLCERKAIEYTVFGFKIYEPNKGLSHLLNVRLIAIFSFLLFSGVLGSFFVPAAINDLIEWMR
ncbi:MAG: 4Fe-4S binding protein [Elusimicrobia bacterium]|nr:4Fe-4S binding protein [Elusimicrobiota bacterium]